MAKKRSSKTKDAVAIITKRHYVSSPARLAALESERLNAKIAREIYALRTERGLTQRRLAKLVGTTPSVISRLEDADYEGRSLSTLQRIAAALKGRVEIRLVPLGSRAQGPRGGNSVRAK